MQLTASPCLCSPCTIASITSNRQWLPCILLHSRYQVAQGLKPSRSSGPHSNRVLPVCSNCNSDTIELLRLNCSGCGCRDQQGADPERVELALKRFEEVYFVAEPGDALFFSALTLHSSRGNFSSERRLAFASCFTRENNVQWKDPCVRVTLCTSACQPSCYDSSR
eukprot:COSAG02_NODE_1350_length_13120_cov_4.275555_7_plen_166_part_00